MNMTPTGIIRRIDDLGRIVIPKDFRRKLGIREGDPFELYYCKNGVAIVKYNPEDSIQHSLEDLRDAVEDELSLKRRAELLQKIAEMAELLHAEQEGVQ